MTGGRARHETFWPELLLQGDRGQIKEEEGLPGCFAFVPKARSRATLRRASGGRRRERDSGAEGEEGSGVEDGWRGSRAPCQGPVSREAKAITYVCSRRPVGPRSRILAEAPVFSPGRKLCSVGDVRWSLSSLGAGRTSGRDRNSEHGLARAWTWA